MKLYATKIWHGVVGASLAASLAAVRATATASESAVFLAGWKLEWACIFKEAFGVSCPGCGLTRSLVLALGGDFGRAFALNPGGPLLLAGLFALCAALLVSAFSRHRSDAPSSAIFPRTIKLGAAAYGGLLAFVLLVNWARVIT
jgi:hypothetical protein